MQQLVDRQRANQTAYTYSDSYVYIHHTYIYSTQVYDVLSFTTYLEQVST